MKTVDQHLENYLDPLTTQALIGTMDMQHVGGWVCRLTHIPSIMVSSMVLQVPSRNWIDINMDIVGGLPGTEKQYDSIWVVVDR